MDASLVINAGSSSIKFCVYLDDSAHTLALKGQLDGLGVGITPHFIARDGSGKTLADESWPPVEVGKQSALLGRLLAWIESHLSGARLAAAGHRVVHGGQRYAAPVRITPEILEALREFIPLAPLHQPHNLSPIAALAELHSDLPQVACFDTAFHRTMPPVAELFGLPRALTAEGVRRYGFHGLSYEYIADALKTLAPDVAGGRVIVAHLGSGASLCALHNGRSIGSTMGFTAVDGLMMGTRTGALDPGVVLYLMQQKGMDAKAIETLLYKQSGLLGVSGGISNDMRVLLDSPAPEAAEAVDLFLYRIRREIGSLIAALDGLDGLVFTAGIGEHSPEIRRRVCSALAWLGLEVDEAANRANASRLSTATSRVAALVIPTDEERMIARHTREVLAHT